MPFLENKTSYYLLTKKINMKTITKIINLEKKIEIFVKKNHGQYINKFLLITVLNRLHDVKINFKKIATYRKAKTFFEK